MSDYLQIMTTAQRKDQAELIARRLVEERLAACVQISGPVTSVYRWQGSVETAEEWHCRIKTRRALFEAVASAIRAVHPYQVPQIVAVPIEAGSADYLAWVEAETTPRALP